MINNAEPENPNKYSSESRRTREVFRNLVLHLHPVKVKRATLKFNHTFGLGGMIALLFMMQVFTGILLRFYYNPSPAQAYDSILHIQNQVVFGQFILNIHNWGGISIVFLAFLHLMRVFYTGAFHPPRRQNWIIGVALLILLIFSNFTGYLLPWDQISYWAVTVSTSILGYIPGIGKWLEEMMLGGTQLGSKTLINFFNFHTSIFPLTIIVLMAFHFWKIRKAGGVVVPGGASNPDKSLVPSDPNLIGRELVVALVLLAVLFSLSVFLNAPLHDRANPVFSPNPVKAPWYFAGIQELLLHFHPFVGGIFIPILFVAGLIYFPFIKYKKKKTGVWFYSGKGKKIAEWSALLALLITPILIFGNEEFIHFDKWLPGLPEIISNGFIPLLLILLSLSGYLFILRRKAGASRVELLIALFTILVVSYIVMTITGIWFRGPGMSLMWP